MSDEQMVKAAEIAQATEFIEAKEKKYKSEIAQGGNNVSGGQKQRLSIARAIVSKPKLILADEPTGAVDTKTGEEIIKIFEDLNKNGQTIILITHDLNIASRAKRTLNIKDGQITGENHENK